MNLTNKSQIVIFGGCFNPPTLAHQEIIEACLKLPDFNEVWVMPSASGYEKTIGTADHDRLAMLGLVKKHSFNNDPRLVISDFELKHPELIETYETVDVLSAKYVTEDFWFAFGADSYNDMPNWGRGFQLQSNLNMIIFERGGIAPPDRDKIIPLSLAKHGKLSSTGARETTINKGDLNEFVCPPIRQYILDNGLYV